MVDHQQNDTLTQNSKVSFLGLGVMGFPMAGHLSTQGYDVSVYNRTSRKAHEWQKQFGGTAFDTPALAAKEAQVVCACVGNDDDLRSVCLGEEGAFTTMEKGSIFIDHTTVSPQVTRELAEIAKNRGISYIDAPVSGGQAGAEGGILSIMCGGDEKVFEQVLPLMQSYGKTIKRLGDVGSGQIAKMCNQVAIAGVVQGLSESLHLAQKSGLDVESLVEVISGGAAGSWQMVNRHKTMNADHYEYGFAVDWMRKDLAICLQAADEVGASLPLTAIVDQFYKDVQKMGGGRWDTSSLLKRLQKFDD